MKLYSQKGSFPAPLPHLIKLSSGQVRTSQTPFTSAEIADAGYVEAPAKPAFDPSTHQLGWDGSNWTVTELPPPPAPRSTAMWRARAIARVTPHGEGTLFDAVLAAIDGLTDPTLKAAATEAWERGTVFDLDGQLVPILMAALGLTEADVLPLIADAEALPA